MDPVYCRWAMMIMNGGAISNAGGRAAISCSDRRNGRDALEAKAPQGDRSGISATHAVVILEGAATHDFPYERQTEDDVRAFVT